MGPSDGRQASTAPGLGSVGTHLPLCRRWVEGWWWVYLGLTHVWPLPFRAAVPGAALRCVASFIRDSDAEGRYGRSNLASGRAEWTDTSDSKRNVLALMPWERALAMHVVSVSSRNRLFLLPFILAADEGNCWLSEGAHAANVAIADPHGSSTMLQLPEELSASRQVFTRLRQPNQEHAWSPRRARPALVVGWADAVQTTRAKLLLDPPVAKGS